MRPALVLALGVTAGIAGPRLLHLASHAECEACDARAVRAVRRQILAEREAQAAQRAQVNSGNRGAR